MPRDLQQTDRNEMIIQDAISACEIVLYYRQPTTPERIGFQRASWVRKGKKVHNRTAEARAHYGALILTGIREGDFSCGSALISSDPASPAYRADWKELVTATAGDLLMLLGMQVFEGSFQELVKAVATTQATSDDGDPDADDPDDNEPEITIEADEVAEILPLEPSSNG